MKAVHSPAKPVSRAVGSTALSAVVHVFGSLTCATCWAIFGPALVLLFGSSGTAFLSTLRPYAPLAIVLSAFGLTYSVLQLIGNRADARALPYRMAAAFTGVSVLGWIFSAGYTLVTLVKG